MDTKLVEKFYNRRFWYILGLGLAAVLWFVIRIIRPFPFYNTLSADAVFILEIGGAILATTFFILLACDENKIKKDPSLSETLNDEMYRRDQLKACHSGFLISMGVSLLIASGSSMLRFMTVESAAYIILLAGIIGFVVPLLIYMKR